MHVLHQGLHAVHRGRELPGQRGIELPFGYLPGRFGVGGGLPPLGVRQVGRQPLPALRLGLWVPADHLDVGQFGPGADEQRECHRQQHLGADEQWVAIGQLVEGGGDRPFDGVLNWDYRALGGTGPDSVESGPDRGKRHGFCLVTGVQQAERRFRECARWAEVRTPM